MRPTRSGGRVESVNADAEPVDIGVSSSATGRTRHNEADLRPDPFARLEREAIAEIVEALAVDTGPWRVRRRTAPNMQSGYTIASVERSQ